MQLAYIRQTSNIEEMIKTTIGAKGQKVDLHPYCCSKIGIFCALIAARKRNDVNAMMDQLIKNEALVIEISQLRTSSPFATPNQQPFHIRVII
jgi:hypothetical protein